MSISGSPAATTRLPLDYVDHFVEGSAFYLYVSVKAACSMCVCVFILHVCSCAARTRAAASHTGVNDLVVIECVWTRACDKCVVGGRTVFKVNKQQQQQQ